MGFRSTRVLITMAWKDLFRCGGADLRLHAGQKPSKAPNRCSRRPRHKTEGHKKVSLKNMVWGNKKSWERLYIVKLACDTLSQIRNFIKQLWINKEVGSGYNILRLVWNTPFLNKKF